MRGQRIIKACSFAKPCLELYIYSYTLTFLLSSLYYKYYRSKIRVYTLYQRFDVGNIDRYVNFLTDSRHNIS